MGIKKEWFVALFALWILSLPALAGAKVRGSIFQKGDMSLGVYLGYTSVFMVGLNEELNDLREDVLEPTGYTNNCHVYEAGNALNAGINFDFALNPDLSIGPRFSVLTMFAAEVYGRGVGISYAPNYVYAWTTNVGATMLTLGGGIAYTPIRTDSNLSLTIGGDAGFALVYGNWTSEYETDDPNWPVDLYNYDIPFTGNGLYLDLYTTVDYDFDRDKTVFLRLGYRLADMDSVTMTKNISNTYPFGQIIEGDPFEGVDNDPVAFDFSGFEISAGIRLYF